MAIERDFGQALLTMTIDERTEGKKFHFGFVFSAPLPLISSPARYLVLWWDLPLFCLYYQFRDIMGRSEPYGYGYKDQKGDINSPYIPGWRRSLLSPQEVSPNLFFTPVRSVA